MLDGNLFVVNGNILKTPSLTDGALNGITRKMLIKTLGKTKDYEVVRELLFRLLNSKKPMNFSLRIA